MEPFKKFFQTGVQTMHSAEKQIAALLPAFITSTNEPQLRATLSEQLQDTLRQIARLETLAANEKFEMLPSQCLPVQALVQEGKDLAASDLPADVKDAAIIANLQCLDHYKIAMYGTLAAHAYALHMPNARKLLHECAKEDGEADHALSRLAEGTLFHHGINHKASQSFDTQPPSTKELPKQ
jgi:ferritin-like metal-binding protein YciE